MIDGQCSTGCKFHYCGTKMNMPCCIKEDVTSSMCPSRATVMTTPKERRWHVWADEQCASGCSLDDCGEDVPCCVHYLPYHDNKQVSPPLAPRGNAHPSRRPTTPDPDHARRSPPPSGALSRDAGRGLCRLHCRHAPHARHARCQATRLHVSRPLPSAAANGSDRSLVALTRWQVCVQFPHHGGWQHRQHCQRAAARAAPSERPPDLCPTGECRR